MGNALTQQHGQGASSLRHLDLSYQLPPGVECQPLDLNAAKALAVAVVLSGMRQLPVVGEAAPPLPPLQVLAGWDAHADSMEWRSEEERDEMERGVMAANRGFGQKLDAVIAGVARQLNRREGRVVVTTTRRQDAAAAAKGYTW